MRKPAQKKILFPAIVLLFGYLAVLTILLLDYNSKKDSLKADRISRMGSAYSAVTEVYKKLTELAFDQFIKNPDFMENYRLAISCPNSLEKNFWRGIIFNRLGRPFESLSYYHIRTLNLIEPDGTVFLRMDRRDLYGDSVLSYSPLQVSALRERKSVHGFQLGRTENLYRYSFPLFWGSNFLGSAEFGLSAAAITEQLNKEIPGNFTLILRKDLVSPLLNPSTKARYIQSVFSSRFLEDRTIRDEPFNSSGPTQQEEDEILKEIHRRPLKQLASGESFLLSGNAGRFPYSVVFLQVKAPGGPPAGYVVATQRDGRFDALKSEYLLFAGLVTGIFMLAGGLVLQWLRYHEKLLDEALYDSLTGGLKQGQFDEIAAREYSMSQRHQLPLSLILFDLDHFKSVNDRFGHLKGDSVLFEIGKTVRSSARDSDYFFRWGGDEFLLVLPATDLEGAHKAAEKLRHLIENMKQEGLEDLSISAGVAQREQADPDLRSVLERTDKALYRAKEKGRNTISE